MYEDVAVQKKDVKNSLQSTHTQYYSAIKEDVLGEMLQRERRTEVCILKF